MNTPEKKLLQMSQIQQCMCWWSVSDLLSITAAGWRLQLVLTRIVKDTKEEVVKDTEKAQNKKSSED